MERSSRRYLPSPTYLVLSLCRALCACRGISTDPRCAFTPPVGAIVLTTTTSCSLISYLLTTQPRTFVAESVNLPLVVTLPNELFYRISYFLIFLVLKWDIWKQRRHNEVSHKLTLNCRHRSCRMSYKLKQGIYLNISKTFGVISKWI